jgi:hypothetical protein
MSSQFKNERRRLPNGSLLYIGNLRPGTTEADLAVSFESLGLEVTMDRLNIRKGERGTHAIVSLPSEEVAKLLNAAIKRKPDPTFRMPIQPVQSASQRDKAWPPQDVARASVE